MSELHCNDIVCKRYRLRSELGKGSFGRVFLGHDIKTFRWVAIKLEEKSSRHSQLKNEYKVGQSWHARHHFRLLNAPENSVFFVVRCTDSYRKLPLAFRVCISTPKTCLTITMCWWWIGWDRRWRVCSTTVAVAFRWKRCWCCPIKWSIVWRPFTAIVSFIVIWSRTIFLLAPNTCSIHCIWSILVWQRSSWCAIVRTRLATPRTVTFRWRRATNLSAPVAMRRSMCTRVWCSRLAMIWNHWGTYWCTLCAARCRGRTFASVRPPTGAESNATNAFWRWRCQRRWAICASIYRMSFMCFWPIVAAVISRRNWIMYICDGFSGELLFFYFAMLILFLWIIVDRLTCNCGLQRPVCEKRLPVRLRIRLAQPHQSEHWHAIAVKPSLMRRHSKQRMYIYEAKTMFRKQHSKKPKDG